MMHRHILLGPLFSLRMFSIKLCSREIVIALIFPGGEFGCEISFGNVGVL